VPNDHRLMRAARVHRPLQGHFWQPPKRRAPIQILDAAGNLVEVRPGKASKSAR
jgi:hypothetical protein